MFPRVSEAENFLEIIFDIRPVGLCQKLWNDVSGYQTFRGEYKFGGGSYLIDSLERPVTVRPHGSTSFLR